MKVYLLKYIEDGVTYFIIKEEVKNKFVKISYWFADLKELEIAVKKRAVDFMYFEVDKNEELKYPKTGAYLNTYYDKTYYEEMRSIIKNSEVLYKGRNRINFTKVKKEFPKLFI